MHQLSAYLLEREGFDSIVMDIGFAAYKISGEECYIKDIWINPDFREQGAASAIADKISDIARKECCTYLTGTVQPSANNSTASLKVLLGYGFELHSSIVNGIYFRKAL